MNTLIIYNCVWLAIFVGTIFLQMMLRFVVLFCTSPSLLSCFEAWCLAFVDSIALRPSDRPSNTRIQQPVPKLGNRDTAGSSARS